jgi:hypothetical protein
MVYRTESWACEKADISRIAVTDLRFLEAQKETSTRREQEGKYWREFKNEYIER